MWQMEEQALGPMSGQLNETFEGDLQMYIADLSQVLTFGFIARLAAAPHHYREA